MITAGLWALALACYLTAMFLAARPRSVVVGLCDVLAAVSAAEIVNCHQVTEPRPASEGPLP